MNLTGSFKYKKTNLGKLVFLDLTILLIHATPGYP